VTASPTVRLLREAATQMREQHPVSHPRHEMWDLMAAVLEESASRQAVLDDSLSVPATPVGVGAVVRVARSYLAAVGRPDVDGGVLT